MHDKSGGMIKLLFRNAGLLEAFDATKNDIRRHKTTRDDIFILIKARQFHVV